ncbi:MAG: 50S ribosomal protein L10 [Patescibacteria group bacterium]
MAITKEKKVEIAKDLKQKIGTAGSVVFVKFHKLPVSEQTALRGTLRKSGSGYTVTKKTLLARALDEAGITGDRPALEGEVAFAFGTDILAPSREVSTFAKSHKESFVVLGGIFEGRYIAAGEVLALGKIPSREVLYAQFLGVLNGPIRSFATVLDAIAKKKAVEVAA